MIRIFFFSFRKGSEPFLGAPEVELPDVREVSNYFWYLPYGNGMGKHCQLIKIPYFVFLNHPGGRLGVARSERVPPAPLG